MKNKCMFAPSVGSLHVVGRRISLHLDEQVKTENTVAALKIWSVSTLTLFFDDLSVAADEMTAVCDVTWKQCLMDEQDQKKASST